MSADHKQFLDALPQDAPDFGKLQQVFPKNKFERTAVGNLAMVVFCLLFVAGAFFLRMKVAEESGGQLEPGPNIATIAVMALFGGCAVFFLVRIFLTYGRNPTQVGRYWLVFDRGLIIFEKGQVAAGYPLRELRVTKEVLNVDSVHAGKKMFSKLVDKLVPHFRLHDSRSEKIRLPLDKRESARIVRSLIDNLVRHRLPRLVEVVQKGKRASFGKVKVARDRLQCGDQSIPFDEIGGIEFSVPNEKDRGPAGLRMRITNDTGRQICQVNASKQMYNVWLFINLIRNLYPEVIARRKSLKELVA